MCIAETDLVLYIIDSWFLNAKEIWKYSYFIISHFKEEKLTLLLFTKNNVMKNITLMAFHTTLTYVYKELFLIHFEHLFLFLFDSIFLRN
jgi:hypothetical protein